MATQYEYAALFAYIYNDQRGGGPLADNNKLDLPPGWQDLSRLGFTTGDNLNNYNPFSFTAGAYINQAGNKGSGLAINHLSTIIRPCPDPCESNSPAGCTTSHREATGAKPSI